MTDEAQWPQWMLNALWDGGIIPRGSRQVPAYMAVDWVDSPSGGMLAKPSPLWDHANGHWMQPFLPRPTESGHGGILPNRFQNDEPPWFDPGPELKSTMPWPDWMRPVAPEQLFTGRPASAPQPTPSESADTGTGGLLGKRYANWPGSATDNAAPAFKSLPPMLGATSWPSPFATTVAAPPPQPQPASENASVSVSMTEDLLRTTPAALARGTTMALGGTGDARELAGKGLAWALQKLGIEPTPETVERFKGALRSNPFTGTIMAAPTSEQLLGAVEENVTGPLYQPQTRAGKYLNTALEFVPGAVAAGPLAGGLRSIPGVVARYGLIPGLASEAAGHATEGTAAEPWARAGTALAAGGAAALTHPSAPRGAAVPDAPQRGASAPARPVVADDVASATSSPPQRATAYAPHEAVPGKGTGHLPSLLDEPYVTREIFSNDPRSSWINPKTGGDVLYKTLGLDTLPTRPATGSFTPGSGPLEINPAQVARPKIGMTSDGAISDDSRELLKIAEHVRAYIDGQNMGAAHALTKNAPLEQLSSINIPINRRINSEDMAKITEMIDPYGFHVSHRGYSPRGKPGQNAPDQLAGGSDEGISLINKGPGNGGRTAQEVEELRKSLEPQIKGVLRDTSAVPFEPVKADSVLAEYEKMFAAANKGQRQATERLAKVLADAPPGTIEALDRSPLFRAMPAARRARDAEWEQAMGGARDDLQRARAIIAERGLRGLLEALERKEILPSVLVPLGLAGVYEAGSPRE